MLITILKLMLLFPFSCTMNDRSISITPDAILSIKIEVIGQWLTFFNFCSYFSNSIIIYTASHFITVRFH